MGMTWSKRVIVFIFLLPSFLSSCEKSTNQETIVNASSFFSSSYEYDKDWSTHKHFKELSEIEKYRDAFGNFPETLPVCEAIHYSFVESTGELLDSKFQIGLSGIDNHWTIYDAMGEDMMRSFSSIFIEVSVNNNLLEKFDDINVNSFKDASNCIDGDKHDIQFDDFNFKYEITLDKANLNEGINTIDISFIYKWPFLLHAIETAEVKQNYHLIIEKTDIVKVMSCDESLSNKSIGEVGYGDEKSDEWFYHTFSAQFGGSYRLLTNPQSFIDYYVLPFVDGISYSKDINNDDEKIASLYFGRIDSKFGDYENIFNSIAVKVSYGENLIQQTNVDMIEYNKKANRIEPNKKTIDKSDIKVSIGIDISAVFLQKEPEDLLFEIVYLNPINEIIDPANIYPPVSEIRTTFIFDVKKNQDGVVSLKDFRRSSIIK